MKLIGLSPAGKKHNFHKVPPVNFTLIQSAVVGLSAFRVYVRAWRDAECASVCVSVYVFGTRFFLPEPHYQQFGRNEL